MLPTTLWSNTPKLYVLAYKNFFSISGTKPKVSGYLENHAKEETEDMMQKSIYNSFPKSSGSTPGSILIHTDTCVSLSLSKGHVTVAAPNKNDDVTYFFVGIIEKLKLLTAVGLERDPEMCLLSVNVKDSKLYFGPSLGVHDSSRFLQLLIDGKIL